MLGGEYTDNLEKHRKVALKHLRFKSEERQTLMERQVPWGECLLPAGQAGPTALRAQDGHQGLAFPPLPHPSAPLLGSLADASPRAVLSLTVNAPESCSPSPAPCSGPVPLGG